MEAWREAFPALEGTYFAWHLRGPLPAPTVQRAETLAHEHARLGVRALAAGWLDDIDTARAAIAALAGTQSEQVALMPNTSTAMATVAWGWPLKAGDTVWLGGHEYPGSSLPFRQAAKMRGFTVRRLEPDADGHYPLPHLLSQVPKTAALVVLSQVVFLTGERIDVEELAAALQERGTPLVVDGVQALGPLRLNMEASGIAAVAGDCRKWLMSPDGTGFLAVAPPWLERMDPPLPGPVAVQESTRYRDGAPTWVTDARRLQNGAVNSYGYVLASHSLRWLLQTPEADLRAHRESLLHHLFEGLRKLGLRTTSPMDVTRSGGLVGIVYGGDTATLEEVLSEENIIAAPRAEALFVSLYGANTVDDVNRLLACLS